MKNTACNNAAFQLRAGTFELCIAQEMLMNAQCFIYVMLILCILHKWIMYVCVTKIRNIRISQHYCIQVNLCIGGY